MFGLFAFNHFTADNDKGKDKFAVVTESDTYKVQESDITKLLPSAKVTVENKDKFNKLRKQVEDGDLDGLFRITEKNGIPEVTYMYSGFPSQSTATLMASYLKEQYTAVMIEKITYLPEVAKQLQMEIPLKQGGKRSCIFLWNWLCFLVCFIYVYYCVWNCNWDDDSIRKIIPCYGVNASESKTINNATC